MTNIVFITTVEPNRTIVLPENFPIDAKVAIVLLSQEEPAEMNAARDLRFQKVMDAIDAALESDVVPPKITDKKLNELIDEARSE